MQQRVEKAIELAAQILQEARRGASRKERKMQSRLSKMMQDPNGKLFTMLMTDQCFRSKRAFRIASQFCYLLKEMGIPKYFSWEERFLLFCFRWLGRILPHLFVPLLKYKLRKECATVILPGEEGPLKKHLEKRKAQGVRINLNHLGEAILGEEEAKRRLQTYIDDLEKRDIEYISVKISTICSQINLVAFEETLEVLEERLSLLYRAASKQNKFVNLDMEEYRDLHLTVELFKRVLQKEEFLNTSAGIVLQSYLPDSFPIQQALTQWAMARVQKGGAPIKIRLVKGANLGMERVEASIKGWPQAPYMEKRDVDANFKRMIAYGLEKEHAKAVHIGIGSHNLFDIAFAFNLRAENRVEKYVCFEMLEGMAESTRRVVQNLSQDMLLYCPTATKKDFVHAIAYLIRRLDENTGPENFLRVSFALRPGSKDWEEQVKHFRESFTIPSKGPRRTQNRLNETYPSTDDEPFKNEPDTDWTLLQNRKFADIIFLEAKNLEINPPQKISDVQISVTSLEFDRFYALGKVANLLRAKRKELIIVMMKEGNKTIFEADTEVSEAIDFVEYYRRSVKNWPDSTPKGIGLVLSPWNFPLAIPTSGIAAALAAGNSVIFKPAPETPLIGWTLIQIFWEAGIPKEALQFVFCDDEPPGSMLVKDERISFVILTGSTDTAKYLLKLRPSLSLMAETGGKNAMIVTDLADRDQAIKDIVTSAFSHAGQKCSAASLLILEAPVYDDPNFLSQLKDATLSLPVGLSTEKTAKVTPLIRPPNETFLRGLTVLEKGESWLVEPKQDTNNPLLWSPGIKMGVTQKSFSYSNELFGPMLSVMRAKNLEDAINLANGTKYGLTSGLHSLDLREQKIWIKRIIAGNCYINRTITGAIVERQPFGGCKESSFGPGQKVGGPFYVTQFMNTKSELPQNFKEKHPLYGQDNFFSLYSNNSLSIDTHRYGSIEQRTTDGCSPP